MKELGELYDFGFLPRRGQFLLIAGQPGAGKSAFALWWTVQMNVKTLYFSADMDAFTAVSRLAACITGYTVESVSDAIENDSASFFEDALLESRVQFCFDSGPTLQDIADEVDAYVEVWDEFPELIVIDNAMNVEAELGEEHAGLRLVFKEVHRLGRETGAAVFMLHHTREEGNPLDTPPRSAIQGKTAQLPERILTVAFDTNANVFKFSPVKNRSGKQDSTGKIFFRLGALPEKASFATYLPPAPVYNHTDFWSQWDEPQNYE